MGKTLHISPSSLKGNLIPPASKSHTMRALLFALLAKGRSEISHFLSSPDTDAMIQAIELLGASVQKEKDKLTITGTAGKLTPASDVIFCGNSGQTFRFIGALAGLIPAYTVLTGDSSIRTSRPAFPLLKGLSDLGAIALSARGDGRAPILIKGPIYKGKASFSGEDSQPVSGLIIAASFAPHPIELTIENPGETPWISLTLSWLKKFQIPYENDSFTRYRLQGGASISGFAYEVPSDFSSLAYPLIGALLTHSELSFSSVDMEDVQGDKAIISILKKMGAHIKIDPKNKKLSIKPNELLSPEKIDVNPIIDALPILATLACFSKGKTLLYNGAIARKKESDRIASIAKELRKMGASIEEREDGLLISPSKLHGASLEAHNDHRIAMALAIAALAARGESSIRGADAISKSYPHFVEDFQSLGASMELI